ncbi:MAG: phage head closure protein [Selenomonadaceae bacterium]|nr:phage head closure protein [Selenomonadaceae bacterium]
MRTEGSIIKQTSTDDLSERIVIVYYETARDNRGNIIKSTENVRCMVWAKVLPLTGKISDTTPERVNTITYRVTVRYRSDIKPDDLMRWRGRLFRLISVPVDVELRHIWTMFDVVEVVQDGRYK